MQSYECNYYCTFLIGLVEPPSNTRLQANTDAEHLRQFGKKQEDTQNAWRQWLRETPLPGGSSSSSAQMEPKYERKVVYQTFHPLPYTPRTAEEIKAAQDQEWYEKVVWLHYGRPTSKDDAKSKDDVKDEM